MMQRPFFSSFTLALLSFFFLPHLHHSPLHAGEVSRASLRELPTQREEIEPLSSDADQLGLRTDAPYTHVNEFSGKLSLKLDPIGVAGLSLTPLYNTPEEPYCRNSSSFQLCQLSATPASHDLGQGWSFNLGYIVARNRTIGSAFADWERVRFVDAAGNSAVFGRDILFQNGPEDGGARDTCDAIGCLPEQADVHFIDRNLRRITRAWEDDGTDLQGFSQQNYFLKEPSGQVTEFLAQRRVLSGANRSEVLFFPIRITKPSGRVVTIEYVGGLDADGTIPEPARIAALVDDEGRRLEVAYYGSSSAYQGMPEQVSLRYGTTSQLLSTFTYQTVVMGARQYRVLRTVSTAEGQTFTITTEDKGGSKPLITQLQIPTGGVVTYDWSKVSFKYIHIDDSDCRTRLADDCFELQTRSRQYMRISALSHGGAWFFFTYEQGQADDEYEVGAGFIDVTIAKESGDDYYERKTRYLNTPIHHTLYKTFEFAHLVGMPKEQRTWYQGKFVKESWDYTPQVHIGGHGGGDEIRVHAVKRHSRLLDNVWLDRTYRYSWYSAESGLDTENFTTGFLSPVLMREQARGSNDYREQEFAFTHRYTPQFNAHESTIDDPYALSLPTFQEERGRSAGQDTVLKRTTLTYDDPLVPFPTSRTYWRNDAQPETETIQYGSSGSSKGLPFSRTFGGLSTITYTQYQFGVPRREDFPVGLATTRGINPDGTLAWENKDGIRTEYHYDGDQRPTRVIRPGRPDEVWRYSDDHLSTDHYWSYRPQDEPVSYLEFDMLMAATPYREDGNPEELRKVQIDWLTLDEWGRLSTKVVPILGVFFNYEVINYYDDLGRLEHQWDSLARVFRYEYDVLGRTTKKTLASSQYNAPSFAVETTYDYTRNTDGHVVTVETSRTPVAGETKVKRLEHDMLGRVVRAATNGHETVITHTPHALGTLVTIRPYNQASYQRQQVMSWLGQLMWESHPEMDEDVTYTYDGRGLQIGEYAGTMPNPAYEYVNHFDGLGRLVLQEGRSSLDASLTTLRPVKRFAFDRYNRLTEATAYNQDTAAAPVTYRYSSFNAQHQPQVINFSLPRINPGSLSQSGRLQAPPSGYRTYNLQLTYDYLGRSREIQHPGGAVQLKTYAKTHREFQVYYGWGPERSGGPDFLNVVSSTRYWNPESEPFLVYMDAGRCQSNDCLPRWSRIIQENPKLEALAQEYLARIQQEIRAAQYTRLATAMPLQETPEFKALTEYLDSLEKASSTQARRIVAFDDFSRPAGFEITSPAMGRTLINASEYQYNAFGFLTGYHRQDELFPSGMDVSFGYDELGRLDEFGVGSQRTVYGYDNAGNFRSRSGMTLQSGGHSFSLPAFSASYSSSDPYRPRNGSVYDRLGRLQYANERNHYYGRDGRASQVTTGAVVARGFGEETLAAKYFYDAFGNRVVSIRPEEGRVTYSLRDAGSVIVTEEDYQEFSSGDNGTLMERRQYVTHNSQAVFIETTQFAKGQSVDTAQQYRMLDRQGNPVLTWESQQLSSAEQQFYAPYGHQMISQNRYKGPHGFTGHDEDPDGMIYMRARFYSPEAGCFTQPDPGRDFDAAVPTSYNLYAYAHHNPLAGYDPTGEALETFWDIANIGIGVVSAVDNISQGNWGAAAIDAGGIALDLGATLIPGVPGGAGTAIKAAGGAGEAASLLAKHGDEMLMAASAAATRLKQNFKKGMAFQDSIGLPNNTKHIDILNGKTSFRVPDFLDEVAKTIGEAKGGKYVHLSTQIKEYLSFAKDKTRQYTFTLYVKMDTKLSEPLQKLIDTGEIILKRIK